FVIQLPHAITGNLRQVRCLRLSGLREVDKRSRRLQPDQIGLVEESRDHKRNGLLRMGSPVLRARQVVIDAKADENRAAACPSGGPGKAEARTEVLPGWIVEHQ